MYENDVIFETNLKGKMMKSVETYVVEINDAIASVKSSSKKIFELLMDAQSNLTNMEYTLVKRDIDVDKSTINKIEKIFANSVVMENISVLPVSWGTLYEISLIDEDVLPRKMKSGKVTSTSTRAQVKRVRAELATATPEANAEEETASPDANAEEASAEPEEIWEEELTAVPSMVRIELDLKVEQSLTADEVRKEVEYVAAQLSREYFEVGVFYNENDFAQAA